MGRPFAPSLTSVSNSCTFSASIRPLNLMTTSPFSALVSFSTRPLLRILTSVRSIAHPRNGLLGIRGTRGTAKKRKQVGIDLFGIGCTHPMRKAGIDFQRRIFHELRGQRRRIRDGNDLVVITMENQCRNINLLEIVTEVGLRERLDAVIVSFDSAHHSLQPKMLLNPFRNLRAWTVVAIERQRKVFIELRPVSRDPGADAVEHFHRQAARIRSCFQHEGRYSADQYSFCDTL